MHDVCSYNMKQPDAFLTKHHRLMIEQYVRQPRRKVLREQKLRFAVDRQVCLLAAVTRRVPGEGR